MGFFEKLKQGLSKTASSISSVFTASELDDEFYDDLEESLILADLGMQTTEEAMQKLRSVVRERHIKDRRGGKARPSRGARGHDGRGHDNARSFIQSRPSFSSSA